ncbi:dTDP-4-dehydrorhamnose reductase [Luteibacter sp. UNCMF331Sha3.1]|uniref:dTDP-4-dehydrorhamnose reductase n=1 Tax=Luteibacter sp. UNCMF331Sha3.1 TaxID=1502760 RepID=UPI0008CE43CE|nr:dTDP-4-dehydrorhamnose reductase [Luteibacter sp. UNCMF331Sha3.1]SEM34523.1 dTDP-4-dehydrorhamnose reductase [Luteibacter sp. UNCMF331Sha3.1]
MKLLLLGANGQLGQTFLTEGGLARRGDLIAATRTGELNAPGRGVVGNLEDLTALASLLDAERPDIVVNAAAYTAVDKAESDEGTASRVNGEALGVIGRWAASHGALVIHFSTDYVFPGTATAPYAPTAATGPQGAYGRSKLAGEEALRASGARHMIFRTAWVYSAVGNNFLRTMLRLGADRDELRVVADQRGTPTTTRLIVAGTLAAIDRYVSSGGNDPGLLGTFHLTASGETTWHGFAEAIFAEAVASGVLARAPNVQPIATAEFPTPARRPAYSVLDNASFAATFGHPLADWRVGLQEVVGELATS